MSDNPEKFDDEPEEEFEAPEGETDSDPEPRGSDGRFKKGHSGNRKGRPPNSLNFKTILAKAITRPRRFRGDNGESVTMSGLEAHIEKAVTDSLKDKPRGGERLNALLKAAGYFDQPAEAVEKPPLTPDEQAILARFLKSIEDDDT